MSLNQHAPSGLVLFNTEVLVLTTPGVEASFKNFSHANEIFKGTKQGDLYLTNARLIFVNSRKNAPFRDLSIPFQNIKNFTIKQPLIGANAVQGTVVAVNGGEWQGSADFEFLFKKGGAVELGKKLKEMATNPVVVQTFGAANGQSSENPPPPPYPGLGS